MFTDKTNFLRQVYTIGVGLTSQVSPSPFQISPIIDTSFMSRLFVLSIFWSSLLENRFEEFRI